MAGGRTVVVAAVAFSIVLGVAVGLGLYTFVHAKGASSLTNDPAACGNCHIMSEHDDGWIKSSHHHVALCNDGHTPHNLVPTYVTKAANGLALLRVHLGGVPPSPCASSRVQSAHDRGAMPPLSPGHRRGHGRRASQLPQAGVSALPRPRRT